MSESTVVQSPLITSRFTYRSSALGGEQQTIVSIPALRELLRQAEKNASKLADRVERRDAAIKEICNELVMTTAYALRVANAVAAMTEGKLLSESSINSAAPTALTSVASDPREVLKYINELLISVEDCVIATVTSPTTTVFPESRPVEANAQVTVDDVRLDAAMTIAHRLNNRTIASSLSPTLSILSL